MSMSIAIGRARSTAAIAALFLTLVTPAAHAQHPVGWVATLLPQYNLMISASIDRLGAWHWVWGDTAMAAPPSVATRVVNTAGGFLLYDWFSGKAQITRVLQTGQVTRAGKYNWSAGWDIVGTGTFLVFYNRANRSGAVGHITAAGAFEQTQYFPPWTMGAWTHVVATDNHVIFYNELSGWAAIGYINAFGYWNEVTGAYLLPFCSTLTGMGQYLLCTAGGSSILAVYDIQAPGYVVTTDVQPTLRWWERAVRHGSNVALLEPNSSTLTIAHIDENGRFVQTDEQAAYYSTPAFPDHAAVYPDRLVSTGDMLFFSRQSHGASMTGRVDYAGVFQPLQTMDLFPGATIAASGAR